MVVVRSGVIRYGEGRKEILVLVDFKVLACCVKIVGKKNDERLCYVLKKTVIVSLGIIGLAILIFAAGFLGFLSTQPLEKEASQITTPISRCSQYLDEAKEHNFDPSVMKESTSTSSDTVYLSSFKKDQNNELTTIYIECSVDMGGNVNGFREVKQ